MRILELTKKFPYPINDGESIAIYNLAKGLHELGASIDLLSLNTSKHFTDLTTVNGDFSHYNTFNAVYHNNDVKYSGAFVNLFTSQSYHVERLHSLDFAKALEKQLKENEYDVILLETVYMSLYTPVIRKWSKAKICLRAHNIEYEIWKRCSDEESNIAKAWYLKVCANRLKKFEMARFSDYDCIAAISQKDLDTFRTLGYKGDSCVIPVGLNDAKYTSATHRKTNSFGFIGSLDWMPNLQGLQWFLSEAWPQIHQAYPDLEFHIAGKNAPLNFEVDTKQNIVFHGQVDCAMSFIKSHSALVVPLFSGSGIRVKILEAMALGNTVITTDIGLEGIDAEHAKNVLIANDAKSFVDVVDFLMKDPQLLTTIGSNAKGFIKEQFNYRNVAKKLFSKLSNSTPRLEPKSSSIV